MCSPSSASKPVTNSPRRWRSCGRSRAAFSTVLSRLPIKLAAHIPLAQFRIRELLQLKAGQVLKTNWLEAEDVPLSVGQVKLGWCEFEVLDKQIGVRLTRLA